MRRLGERAKETRGPIHPALMAAIRKEVAAKAPANEALKARIFKNPKGGKPPTKIGGQDENFSADEGRPLPGKVKKPKGDGTSSIGPRPSDDDSGRGGARRK